MHAQVHSVALTGVDALAVRVEASIAGGLPGVHLVGLPDAAVREARERVRAALRSVRMTLPASRVVVNLAPADVRKEGPGFDLPIALALLAAQGRVPATRLADAAVVGELGLDGQVRPVPGVLAAALLARSAGRRALVVPAEQAAEARSVAGLEIVAVASLGEAIAWARGSALPTSATQPGVHEGARVGATGAGPHPQARHDLAHVRGQAVAKRALEIAAAGRHHLLLFGPPGSGKTLLARCLVDVLPPLDERAALEVARLHSLARLGRRPDDRRAPLRAPHHSLSLAGLVGTPDALGELSLAHHGVLFLDELAEFERRALEALREPLEAKAIELARARARRRLPADVQLVAAMNPCPCGMAGDAERACRCLPTLRRRYLARVSGPLLDRIALRVRVDAHAETSSAAAERTPPSAATTAEVAVRVAAAHAEARSRQGCRNAELDASGLQRFAPLPAEAGRLLSAARRDGRIGERGVDGVRRVARTIADLAGRAALSCDDVAEALVYRAELTPAEVP